MEKPSPSGRSVSDWVLYYYTVAAGLVKLRASTLGVFRSAPGELVGAYIYRDAGISTMWTDSER